MFVLIAFSSGRLPYFLSLNQVLAFEITHKHTFYRPEQSNKRYHKIKTLFIFNLVIKYRYKVDIDTDKQKIMQFNINIFMIPTWLYSHYLYDLSVLNGTHYVGVWVRCMLNRSGKQSSTNVGWSEKKMSFSVAFKNIELYMIS